MTNLLLKREKPKRGGLYLAAALLALAGSCALLHNDPDATNPRLEEKAPTYEIKTQKSYTENSSNYSLLPQERD